MQGRCGEGTRSRSRLHRARLLEAGGYEVVHESPGLELGVYVLVAPEPDRQQPHEYDEVYVVLEGRGTLELEGERFALHEGGSVFVPAGAEHRFVGYEQLCVLVIFEKTAACATGAQRPTRWTISG